MITRYRIALDGVYLEDILEIFTTDGDATSDYEDADNRNENSGAISIKQDMLVIYDIQHSAPEYQRTIETPGGVDGGIITREYREKCSVTVTFALRVYDTAIRNAACQRIKAWAMRGGSLTVSDRPGQVLRNVVCEQFPEINSVRNWLDPLTMTFSAYWFPYWESETPTQKTFRGTNETESAWRIYGNAPESYVYVDVFPNEDGVNWFKIQVGDTMIELEKNSFSLSNTETLQITYDKAHNIIIRKKTVSHTGAETVTSLLSCRTAESSDTLKAKMYYDFHVAGQDYHTGKDNKVNVRSNKAITTYVLTSGAWL